MDTASQPVESCRRCPHPGCGRRVAITDLAGEGLSKCSRCRQVVYCSKDCQKAAWRDGHKHECKVLQLAAAAEEALKKCEPASRAGREMSGKDDASDDETDENCPWSKKQVCRVPGWCSTKRQERVYDDLIAHYNSGEFRGISEMAEDALEVAGELEEPWPTVAAQMLRIVAIGYCQDFETQKAIEVLDKGAALAQQADHKPVLGRILSCAGDCHRMAGAYELAIEVLERSVELAVEVGDREDEDVALSNLALCYESLKEYGRAVELHERCIVICEEMRHSAGTARSYCNMGRCLSYDGQHKRAVACLKYAWEFFDREGDGETVARSSLQIGQVSWMQVRAEYHQAASDDAGSNDGAPQYADTLADAEVWLRKALDLAWKNYICNFIADAQIHLACLVCFKGDEDEAVELLTKHMEGFMQMGPRMCAGCMQLRGGDAPMLICAGCRVARFEYE